MLNSEKANSKIESVIGAGTEIEGNIQTNESVRIDGKIKGFEFYHSTVQISYFMNYITFLDLWA